MKTTKAVDTFSDILPLLLSGLQDDEPAVCTGAASGLLTVLAETPSWIINDYFLDSLQIIQMREQGNLIISNAKPIQYV